MRIQFTELDPIIIERVTQFKFLGLNIDSNLNWNSHLSAVSTKVSRVIGLLHKLKYVFPSYIFHSSSF